MSNQPPPSQPPEDPRVRFAAERTLLAWMRTGLALMGFGFVVARFGLFLREIAAAGHVTVHQHTTGWSLWLGTGLIALGVAVSLLASFEYFRFVQLAKRGHLLQRIGQRQVDHAHVEDVGVAPQTRGQPLYQKRIAS